MMFYYYQVFNKFNRQIQKPVLPGIRSMRRDDYFDLTKKRLEKSRGEFFFRTQRIANRLHHSIDFGNQHGLKHRILKQMWNYIMMRYKPWVFPIIAPPPPQLSGHITYSPPPPKHGNYTIMGGYNFMGGGGL